MKPKIPFLLDFDTVFNVQGDPTMKALYHTESRRVDGHPDSMYARKIFEEHNIQEELIKKAIDRMNGIYADAEIPEKTDLESDRKKRIETLLREERELPRSKKFEPSDTTTTSGNFHGHRFVVPREVYSNPQYREFLNHAEIWK